MILFVIEVTLFSLKKPAHAVFYLVSYFTYKWSKKVFKLSGEDMVL